MPAKNDWAVGVDLGGTKIIVAQVDTQGILHRKLRLPTNVSRGPTAVKSQVVAAVQKLMHEADCLPVGVGVGVAGQVDAIVSGDADLLVLNPFEGIPVLRPAEFLVLI